MVICLGRGADLHMAQLMPLPLTISCSSKSRLVLPFWYRLSWVVLETYIHTYNRFMALLDFCSGLPGWAGTRRVKPIGFTGARDGEWQWHQLSHMLICTLTQTQPRQHPITQFFQAGCPSCRPTNSVKALNALSTEGTWKILKLDWKTLGFFFSSKRVGTLHFYRMCIWIVAEGGKITIMNTSSVFTTVIILITNVE